MTVWKDARAVIDLDDGSGVGGQIKGIATDSYGNTDILTDIEAVNGSDYSLTDNSNVTNVATIGMNNLNVSGNAFTGNQVTVSSNQLGGLLTGNSSVNVQGGFFGPQALNVGGVLSVDDTASGVLSIQGAFTGTR